MTVLYVEVVVGSEHIGGDDCRILTAVLLEVRPANTNTHTHAIPKCIRPKQARALWRAKDTLKTSSDVDQWQLLSHKEVRG